MTDASGHYFLKNLPEGEFTMEVSAVGYKTVSRKVTLRKGKTLEEKLRDRRGSDSVGWSSGVCQS